MQLCVIHDKTMRVSESFKSLIHRLAVDVDPAGSSRSQEVPVSHRGEVVIVTMCVFLPGCVFVLLHLLVDLFYLLYDLGTFSVSNVLTSLPETQVLR